MPIRRNVTLDKTLTIAPSSTDQLDLPRDHVIDDILLRFHFSYSASSAPSLWDILRAIQEVRVVSDGSVVHWALRGDDIYVLNYYDQQGSVPVSVDTSKAVVTLLSILYLRCRRLFPTPWSPVTRSLSILYLRCATRADAAAP